MRSWPAHQLHAWGNRHAEASARVHCNAFASPDDFVEVFSRRYDNLGKHTPVISTGAVVAQGERHELHGALRGLAARATIEPNRYRFTIRGPFLSIEGEVHCALGGHGRRLLPRPRRRPRVRLRRRPRRDRGRGAPPRRCAAGRGRRGCRPAAAPTSTPAGCRCRASRWCCERRAGTGARSRCRCCDWAAAPAGVRVSFTCRHGGVSSGPFASLNLGALTADDAANVAENRRRAVAGAGGDGATATMAWQVHGTRHPRGDRHARLGALPAARRRAVPEVGRPGHQQPRPGADAAHRRLPAGRDRSRRRQPAGAAARGLAWHRGRHRSKPAWRRWAARRWPRSGPGRGRAATRWARTWPAR